MSEYDGEDFLVIPQHDTKEQLMEIHNKNQQGTLLTASCLKSRWSWLYGQLWLFPNGLLRLPLPWVPLEQALIGWLGQNLMWLARE